MYSHVSVITMFINPLYSFSLTSLSVYSVCIEVQKSYIKNFGCTVVRRMTHFLFQWTSIWRKQTQIFNVMCLLRQIRKYCRVENCSVGIPFSVHNSLEGINIDPFLIIERSQSKTVVLEELDTTIKKILIINAQRLLFTL